MKTERSDIEYPVWRKKVDTTILGSGCTPIPNWVMKVWGIEERFGTAISKKTPDASVSIFLKGKNTRAMLQILKEVKLDYCIDFF